MELLYLNEGDVTELLDMPGAISVVEDAFLEHGMGRVQMPPKSYLYFPTGDLRTMPAYLETAGIAGVKIVNVHPKNPDAGLPTVMAVIVLNSIETGAPLSVMDGTYLTEMRTGAAGGVAADRLARTDAAVVGMVGSQGHRPLGCVLQTVQGRNGESRLRDNSCGWHPAGLRL